MSSKKPKPDPTQWARIQELFHQALELPPAAREDYLRDASRGSQTVYAEAQKLLRAAGAEQGVLTEIVSAVAHDKAEVETRQLVGMRVGAYRLVRLLGQGGMGSVYLAERDDAEFEHQVAIKLINPAMLGPETLRRFSDERQILARLEHPNISRLLDGGTTEDALPFLAMEYVVGVPILQYCDSKGLGIPARLRLFKEVCAAVDYAHRNLVIHRDLKPNNIMVTAEGVPKLLDFGIAKLSGQDGTLAAATVANLRVLTPASASPEQILGQNVTTASDIYSLGLLLYRLLCGHAPFDFEGLTTAALERLVCDKTPPPPSARLADFPNDNTLTTHGLTHGRLRRELSGDLDNIVMRAMRQSAARRYGSAAQFSHDIDRYLNHLPVLARRNSWLHVARKFVRRNRVAVAAGVVVLTTISGLIGFYTQRVGAERDKAQLEADRSTKVTEFLVSVFALSNASETRAAEVTAHELLDAGAARIETELDDQPALRAKVLNTIGRVYYGIGVFDKARRLQTQALALNRQAYGDVHPEVINTLQSLGETEFELGELKASENHLGEAVDIARSLWPGDRVETAAAINKLGHTIHWEGRYDEAESKYVEALEMLVRLGVRDGRVYPDVLTNIAQVKDLKGELGESETLHRQALNIYREMLGPESIEALNTEHNLAVAIEQQRRWDEAEALFVRSLQVSRRVLGDDHPHVSAGITSLGRMYHEMGELEKAMPLYAEALERTSRSFGPEHTYTGYDTNNMASLLADLDRFDEAEKNFERALAIYASALDADHPYVASSLVAYGRALNRQGKAAAARTRLERAVEICAVALPEDHWLTASARSELGESLRQLGRRAAAEPLLTAGLAVLGESRGTDDRRTRRAQKLLDDFRSPGSAASAD